MLPKNALDLDVIRSTPAKLSTKLKATPSPRLRKRYPLWRYCTLVSREYTVDLKGHQAKKIISLVDLVYHLFVWFFFFHLLVTAHFQLWEAHQITSPPPKKNIYIRIFSPIRSPFIMLDENTAYVLPIIMTHTQIWFVQHDIIHSNGKKISAVYEGAHDLYTRLYWASTQQWTIRCIAGRSLMYGSFNINWQGGPVILSVYNNDYYPDVLGQ